MKRRERFGNGNFLNNKKLWWSLLTVILLVVLWISSGKIIGGKTYNLREFNAKTGEVMFDMGKIQDYKIEGDYIQVNNRDGINIYYKAREGTIIRIEEAKQK